MWPQETRSIALSQRAKGDSYVEPHRLTSDRQTDRQTERLLAITRCNSGRRALKTVWDRM